MLASALHSPGLGIKRKDVLKPRLDKTLSESQNHTIDKREDTCLVIRLIVDNDLCVAGTASKLSANARVVSPIV